MQIDERAGPFRIAFPTANSTAASIVEPVPTYTRPSGDGVIDFNSDFGGVAPTRMLVLPYGVAATNTCLMNIYGWRVLPAKTSPHVPIFIPYFLSSFTVTFSTVPGLDNADVGANQRFAGTIVIVKAGTVGLDYGVFSPTGNSVASFWQNIFGASLVSIVTGLNSSSTSVNALVCTI